MEVKLIHGKWKAVFESDTECFFNLNDVQRKLFAVLMACECILVRHNLTIESKTISNFGKIKLKLQNFFSSLLSN